MICKWNNEPNLIPVDDPDLKHLFLTLSFLRLAACTPMRGGKIQFRTDGYDAVRVDGLVTGVIMLLDVLEIHGLGDAG